MNFVMGAMFIVLPALWMAAFSWAGIRIGEIARMAGDGVSNVKAAAGSIGEKVTSKITN